MIESPVRRDTAHWIFQTWASFGAAALCSVVGAWNLPSGGLDAAFVFMALCFLLFCSLTLSKHLRDAQAGIRDTPAFRFAVWTAFGLSCGLACWGTLRLAAPEWHKAFLGASELFLLSSSFTLAKTLRDRHEAENAPRIAAPK